MEQMEETRRRKEEEKARIKLQDEELEQRVKAELAGESDAFRRQKEAQRTAAAQEIEKMNEVYLVNFLFIFQEK